MGKKMVRLKSGKIVPKYVTIDEYVAKVRKQLKKPYGKRRY